MTAKAEAIAAVYAQVSAPQWAAPNLDALADVLRDLSWLPEGPVPLTLPDLTRLSADERQAVLGVLARAVTDSVAALRPIRIREDDERT